MAKQFDTSEYVQRPSEKEGRTSIVGAKSNQDSTQTIYTITSGKTLYVTNIILSWFNTNTTDNGILEIHDNGTMRIPAILPPTTVGNDPISGANITTSFAEPISFLNAFKVVIISGTIKYSISFSGYEE